MGKRLALVALTAALAAAAPAQAADWKDGGTITDPAKSANGVGVAVKANGEAAFTTSYSDDPRPLMRRRLPGQPLGAPQTLFETDASASTTAAGDEFLTTISAPGATPNRIVAQSRVGDALTTDTIVEVAGDVRICATGTALAANGTAIVVYGTSPGGDTPPPGTPCNLFARVRPAAAQPFGQPVAIGETGRFSGGMAVALDPNGRGFVIWRTPDSTRLNATAFDAATGFAPTPQVINVLGERPAESPSPIVRVAPTGRAFVAFPSRTATGSNHIAVATGDTRTGFAPTEIVSGPAILQSNFAVEFDGAIGEDGTIGLTWRAGKDSKARIQGLVANPTELVTSEQTEALSDYGARGPRMAVAQGRVTFAWFRLVPNLGRAIEASFGRPDTGIGRAQRISDAPVAVGVPHVTTAKRGETWITWGFKPAASTNLSFQVLQARKLTLGNNTYSRVLDVLRAPTGQELSLFYTVAATTGGGMAASVDRRAANGNLFFQLRTYGE